jgi:hypothetical protein
MFDEDEDPGKGGVARLTEEEYNQISEDVAAR